MSDEKRAHARRVPAQLPRPRSEKEVHACPIRRAPAGAPPRSRARSSSAPGPAAAVGIRDQGARRAPPPHLLAGRSRTRSGRRPPLADTVADHGLRGERVARDPYRRAGARRHGKRQQPGHCQRYAFAHPRSHSRSGCQLQRQHQGEPDGRPPLGLRPISDCGSSATRSSSRSRLPVSFWRSPGGCAGSASADRSPWWMSVSTAKKMWSRPA